MSDQDPIAEELQFELDQLHKEHKILQDLRRFTLINSALTGVCASSSFGGLNHHDCCAIAINRADMTLALMTTTHQGPASPMDREGKKKEHPHLIMPDPIP